MTDRDECRPMTETVDDLERDTWKYVAVASAAELRVFPALQHGAKTATELAESIGCDPHKLRPLLHALTVIGLLERTDDRFANSDEAARCLVPGSRDYRGEWLAHVWRALRHTPDTIRTGRGLAGPDVSRMSPDEVAHHFATWHAAMLRDGNWIAEHLDCAARHRLLDMGGGSGGVALALLERLPGMQATVAELPVVADVARKFAAQHPAGDRLNVIATDATTAAVDGSFDLIVMRSFLQALGPDACREALRHAGQAAADDALLIVIGGVLDDSRETPVDLVGYNLVYLNVYEFGQAYTESEYRDWITLAGFHSFSRQIRPDGSNVVTAKKRPTEPLTG